MSIRADENEIVGSWKMIDGRMVEDEASKRIRALAKDELKPIAVSSDGWERLYEDPRDHRLWELTYPSGEMQGGGPPALRVIDGETARKKYQIEAL
jgi:immunity protein 27 of polymorphic toxin system